MPIVNYDLARSWWWLYRTNVQKGGLQDHPLYGQTVTYGRTRACLMAPPFGELSWHTQYWTALTSAITIPADAHLLFVGAGFGFIAEVARAAGWTSIACIDDSNWIHANKAELGWRLDTGVWVQDTPNATETILQFDLSATAQIKNALKSVYGTAQGEPDWVISEFMLSSLTDPTDPLYDAGQGDSDDVSVALDDCDALVAPGGTVLHLVTTAPNAVPPFNVKSLSAWKAIRPAHLYAPAYYGTDFEVL